MKKKKRQYEKPAATVKKIDRFFFACQASAIKCSTLKQRGQCNV
jgi:hypothetical protein